eukprot:s219_g22.t1
MLMQHLVPVLRGAYWTAGRTWKDQGLTVTYSCAEQAIGELADHIGAGGASFIQVAGRDASSTGINFPAGQSQHPPHEAGEKMFKRYV